MKLLTVDNDKKGRENILSKIKHIHSNPESLINGSFHFVSFFSENGKRLLDVCFTIDKSDNAITIEAAYGKAKGVDLTELCLELFLGYAKSLPYNINKLIFETKRKGLVKKATEKHGFRIRAYTLQLDI